MKQWLSNFVDHISSLHRGDLKDFGPFGQLLIFARILDGLCHFFSLSVATILDAGLGHFFSHFPLQQFWMLDLVIFFSLPFATILDMVESALAPMQVGRDRDNF